MAEKDLQLFLTKVEQLNAFVALSQRDLGLGEALRNCADHQAVVALALQHGFAIGRRWGEGPGAAEPEQPQPANLLVGQCPDSGQEYKQRLVETPGLWLERIHSCSYSGSWQQQPFSEWVTLLRGSAELAFLNPDERVLLRQGDQLLIEPHRRHRVVATDPAPGTLWLALFWGSGP